jgi:hypothetical protein
MLQRRNHRAGAMNGNNPLLEMIRRAYAGEDVAPASPPTRAPLPHLQPRQRRSIENRLNDPNAGVRAQAEAERRQSYAAVPYGPGGITNPPPPSFPIGPGGLTTEGPAPTAADDARYQRQFEQAGQWGRDAAALANETRYRPRYAAPDTRAAALQQQFGGRLPPIGPGGVVSSSPSARASAETGIPQPYLDELISHESGGDNRAKASTSSATGPAQFIDSTWLRMMREHGYRYGLPRGASDSQILGLRTDPNWAALMASEYTHENRRAMSSALRRPITEGEAYLGHFLGANDAADLIEAARHGMHDARRFVSRDAVESNRSIFYDANGRPRTAAQVVQLQTGRFRNTTIKGDR